MPVNPCRAACALMCISRGSSDPPVGFEPGAVFVNIAPLQSGGFFIDGLHCNFGQLMVDLLFFFEGLMQQGLRFL